MNAIELNASIYQSLSMIAHDETLLRKAARALRRIAEQYHTTDETHMTEEEFFAQIAEAEREIAEGKGVAMLSDESLDDFLKRVG
ncbi:MAG: hypothetical protein IJT30_02675 [Muribaculaceae bacterium]|nr:hypothetical protein [Muribaculaceae bacterium]